MRCLIYTPTSTFNVQAFPCYFATGICTSAHLQRVMRCSPYINILYCRIFVKGLMEPLVLMEDCAYTFPYFPPKNDFPAMHLCIITRPALNVQVYAINSIIQSPGLSKVVFGVLVLCIANIPHGRKRTSQKGLGGLMTGITTYRSL